MGLDNRENLLRLERFRQVGMRANQPPLEMVKHPIAARGDHQDGALQRWPGFEQADDLVALQFGQAQINENETRGVCFGRVEPKRCD